MKSMRVLFAACWLLSGCLLGCVEKREALLAKAATCLAANNIDAAKETYQRILAGKPEDPDAIRGMVAVSRLLGATEEHVHWCRELLCFRPWDREANLAVGKQLMVEGNLKDAAARLILAFQESIYKQDKREVLDQLEKLRLLEAAKNSGENRPRQP